jgi:hypothetical protein
MWPEQRGITVAQAIRFGKCAARFAAVSTIPTAKTFQKFCRLDLPGAVEA